MIGQYRMRHYEARLGSLYESILALMHFVVRFLIISVDVAIGFLKYTNIQGRGR